MNEGGICLVKAYSAINDTFNFLSLPLTNEMKLEVSTAAIKLVYRMELKNSFSFKKFAHD